MFTNMVGNIPFLNHIIRSLNVFELRSTLAIRWRRKWQPTSALLPGKPHEQRNLVGYRPWGCKESDMTERLHFHFFTSWQIDGGKEERVTDFITWAPKSLQMVIAAMN